MSDVQQKSIQRTNVERFTTSGVWERGNGVSKTGVPLQALDIAQPGHPVPVIADPKSLPADKFGYACATAGNVYCFGSLLSPFDRNRGGIIVRRLHIRSHGRKFSAIKDFPV